METAAGSGVQGWLRRIWRWLVALLQIVLRVLFIGWASLALYFSILPWPALRLGLAIAFAVFGIWALWFARRPLGLRAFAAGFAAVLVLWLCNRPSHDRVWRADVAVMPRVSIDGDRVRITGVRNFAYRSVDDFTPRYETREVSLSRLRGVDFYISYWMPGPIGHTFLSFVFDDALPLSISIEARPEAHEGYAPIASLFKQLELIYVVGDERDIVRVRTNYRREDVYLYRIATSRAAARRLFLVYLERINELAARPEYYHLLSNSCTVNIVRYANAAGRQRRFDIRHYLNGWIDGYLYDSGRLETRLPFEEMRRRSQINRVAQAAGDAPNFSERIRAALPTVMPR